LYFALLSLQRKNLPKVAHNFASGGCEAAPVSLRATGHSVPDRGKRSDVSWGHEPTGSNVGQASRLPVRAASLPLKRSAGKDARRTGSQDGRPTTARFMEQPEWVVYAKAHFAGPKQVLAYPQ